jgi:hypothetical protein
VFHFLWSLENKKKKKRSFDSLLSAQLSNSKQPSAAQLSVIQTIPFPSPTPNIDLMSSDCSQCLLDINSEVHYRTPNNGLSTTTFIAFLTVHFFGLGCHHTSMADPQKGESSQDHKACLEIKTENKK